MGSDTIYYFGYGSLVNRATRPPAEPAWNARLHGWHREWTHRVRAGADRAGCTSLSVRPSASGAQPTATCIDGVIVALARSALPGLDARESGYERLALPRDAFDVMEAVPAMDTVYLYRSLDARVADDDHPILRSYVDCVLSGYQERFGDDSLEEFLASTEAWSACILDDRTAARYPRAVSVTPAQTQRFDALLASLELA